MIHLHYYPGNASMTPHVLLEEIGVPFELKLVDRTQGAHKSPEYLKLNPNGLIPLLIHGDLVLYETAAICLHLADAYPQAGLVPAFGTRDRSIFYKWLAWLSNTLQAMMPHYFYPDRMADDAAGAAQVKAHAQAKIGAMLDQLDSHLASHAQPWMLGANYSLLDPYAFMLCRWTRGFEGAASAPARTRPHLGPYLQRVLARPAVQRAIATEGLAQPWV